MNLYLNSEKDEGLVTWTKKNYLLAAAERLGLDFVKDDNTVLQKKLHNFVLSGVEHLDGATDDYALCKKDDHIAYKNLAIKRCLEL